MSLFDPSFFKEIYVCAEPVDFRRSIDGLCSLIESAGYSPGSGDLFIFTNRARNRLKMVVFDNCSAWLLYRRLHKGKLHWQVSRDGILHLNKKQLEYLLEGLSLDGRILERKEMKYY